LVRSWVGGERPGDGHPLLLAARHLVGEGQPAVGQVDPPQQPDIAWCESGFNLVHAASDLHLHRNTLIYRLNKIARLTGRAVKDYRGALALYLACLADQLGDEEP